MICLLCRRAETVDGLISVGFERGEKWLVVNNVPARMCPNCDEAYVREDVAMRLLQEAEAMYAVGAIDGEVEYNGGT